MATSTCRKMVRRIPTNDLTFGRWPAPPPVSMPGDHNSMGVSNILKCFTEQGMAVNEESLSPIAMVRPFVLVVCALNVRVISAATRVNFCSDEG